MIRKPAADWNRQEGAAARAARKAVNVADSGVRVARSGGHFLRGLFCYFLAGLWGLAALFGGLLGGSMPTFIGVGAMAAGMAWAGRRAFVKGRQSEAQF